MVERVLGHHQHLFDGERLLQEVESPQLGGLDGGLDASVAGDDHHLGALGQGHFLNARQHLHAVQAGQPDVQQHQLEGASGEQRQAGFAVLGGIHRIAFVLQHAAEGLADAGLVIHHQNAPGFHDPAATARAALSVSASTGTGISTVKRAPTGRLSSTRICAWCSATIWLTMARPRPVPRFLVEK